MNFTLSPSVQTVPVIGFFVFFTVKHLLADYMLQTAAMVAGKEATRGMALSPLDPRVDPCGRHVAADHRHRAGAVVARAG